MTFTGKLFFTFRAIQGFIQYVIPDVPEWVEVKIEREKYITKQKMFKSEMGGAMYKEIFEEQTSKEQAGKNSFILSS